DLDMGEAAPLAMDRDRVVGEIADPVGLVVADDEIALALEEIEEDAGIAGVAVIEDAGMPLPADALEDRREGMHRDEHRRPGGRLPPVELLGEAAVIGPESLVLPLAAVGRAEPMIAGDLGRFADLDDRGRHGEVAVAVDDEARIGLPDEEGVEGVGEEARGRL